MAPPKKKPSLVLLVDGDMLVYKAAEGNQRKIDWRRDGNVTVIADLEGGKRQLDNSISKLSRSLNAERVVMTLSDYVTPWRKTIMPTYKENRSGVKKPELIPALREHVHANYLTYQRPGMEGDDILGILLTSALPIQGNKVIVSDDKDMKTIPGNHYNLKHDVFFTVTKAEAERWHMTQTLTGDSTDGYKGARGVGKVKAAKVLGDSDTYAEMWPRVVEAFIDAGQDYDEALVNARVARICRAEDYDFKNKRVVLWTPPEPKEV